MHPEAQQKRIKENVNFTAEHDPDKSPCPAEAARPLDAINNWGGNVAKPNTLEQNVADAKQQCEFYQAIAKAIRESDHYVSERQRGLAEAYETAAVTLLDILNGK